MSGLRMDGKSMGTHNILLITGTDTGVGKTWVACGLAKAFTRQGLKVVGIKPVETGTGDSDHSNEDGVQLARATGQDSPVEALTRLREPVAPPVAADSEGANLNPMDWIRAIESYRNQSDLIVVEGAGGLLSPLTWSINARDLARQLHAPALVVIGNRLGCVNQTLLTLEALKGAQIPLAGLVLNNVGCEDLSVESNRRSIERVSGVEKIITVPHVKNGFETASYLEPITKWILK